MYSKHTGSCIFVLRAKRSKPIGLDFFICVRRTQHHLTEGQHHFEQSENIISHSSEHKTILQQVANDVMLRINDVALRANTTLVFAP